jgi:hypothetical protein
MPHPYIVHRGDDLPGIAARTLGDPALAGLLAEYNALASADDIVVGQAIHLPGRNEMKAPRRPRSRARAAIAPWPPAPHGLAAISATFGEPARFPPVGDNQPNPQWEAQFIVSAKLPRPIPVTFNPAVSTRSLRCHKLVAPLYEAVFADVLAQGLWDTIRTTGGGYTWRMKRGQAKPSTHTWGIAFDLNDKTNAMGTPGDMAPALVALFESYGFTWGGRWSGSNRDPMHFQYCSGY